jgi:hypothetical protein
VGCDDDIEAIIEVGRQTRTPTPRWLWIAATIVSVICVICFMVMMGGDREIPSDPPSRPIDSRPAASSGLGIGLAIGVGVGIAIGFSIGRQRRSHSSRNSP